MTSPARSAATPPSERIPAQSPPGAARWRRLLPPVATLAGVLAATVYIRTVDPNQPGHYPACPTLALLGIDCPGCGGLRATHALANGDIAAALDHNLLLVLAVPVVAVLAVRWILRSWSGRPAPPPSARSLRWQRLLMPIIVGGLLIYTVLRNVVPYLDSGLS